MALNITLHDLFVILGIIGTLGAWFHMGVIRPIREVLYLIKDEIKELKDDIAKSREDRRTIDARVARVEESVKSAHHRIDELLKSGL